MDQTELIRELQELSAQEIAEKCVKEGLKLIVEDGKVIGIEHE